MEFYAAERKKELIPFAMAWMELESIMLSEISLSPCFNMPSQELYYKGHMDKGKREVGSQGGIWVWLGCGERWGENADNCN